jgi:hypothetical protein
MTTTEKLAIYSNSVLRAQAVKLTGAEMDGLKARADMHREFLGETEKQIISVPVIDHAGVRIGSVDFLL